MLEGGGEAYSMLSRPPSFVVARGKKRRNKVSEDFAVEFLDNGLTGITKYQNLIETVDIMPDMTSTAFFGRLKKCY